MRQIHAAIEHLQRGDIECAMTLAVHRRRNVASHRRTPFRELARMTEVNDIVDWLRLGPMKDKENRRRVRGQTVTIQQSEAIFVIYRAIAKFDAVFGDQKTPQWSASEFAQLDACESGSTVSNENAMKSMD